MAVGNGQEALAKLEQGRFSLRLMANLMLVPDRVAATRRICDLASAALAHVVPVAASTAYALRGDVARFIAVGINDYATEPVRYSGDLSGMVY